MRHRVRSYGVLIVGLGLGVSACTIEGHVQTMFANEYSCNEDDVQVEDETGGRYRVAGCEQSVMYTCVGRVCVPDVGKESATAAPSTPAEPAPTPSAKQDGLGVAHREKNAAGADFIALEVRLNAESLLKLRAAADGTTPVELTVVRLASEAATPDCDLAALVDGQRVELPKAKLLKKFANEDPNYRNVTVLGTQVSPAFVHDLAVVRQFAVRICETRVSVPPAAIPEVRHFAALYEEDLAWNGPPRAGGSGGFLAPAGGWPAWKVTDALPAAVTGGATLEAPALFKALSPSVFRVVVASSEGTSQGSAVAISHNELVTNCHVLEGAQKITLQQGKLERRAELSRANPAADRCVLSVTEANLTPIRGVRSYDSLEVGEPLFTLGSPSGLELSLANGLLSAKREDKGVHLVQTTAPISPGSSGGGLFDARGNLVGITTKVLVDHDRLNQALNFAIPADSFWQP